MRKPTLMAIALSALLTVAFQNCGKLGFSLASNDKTKDQASLAVLELAPELSVTGDVPVKAGADASLAVLTKHVVEVSYACARSSDGVVVGQGKLELMDGAAVLDVTVTESLTCTFVGTSADQRTAQTVFEVPLEAPTPSSPPTSL